MLDRDRLGLAANRLSRRSELALGAEPVAGDRRTSAARRVTGRQEDDRTKKRRLRA